LDRPGPL